MTAIVTPPRVLLKHIIHDWDDARAIDIMKSIHRASKPGAKLQE